MRKIKILICNFREMKTNYLLMTVLSLFILFGCSSDGEIATPAPPEKNEILQPQCELCEGDILTCEPTFIIEYFDKEGVGFKLLKGGQEYLDYTYEYMTFEIISFIDEITGKSALSHMDRFKEGIVDSVNRINFSFVTERFLLDSPEATRNYVLKYKEPSFMGESIEEIKCIYHHHGGIKGIFTEVWYNGEQIPIIDFEDIENPFITETGGIIDYDGYYNAIKETHYTGKPVVIRQAKSFLYFVLPYEKP